MAVISGNTFGIQLCEALGLPPGCVRGITITCYVGEVVRVKIEVDGLHDSVNSPALLAAIKQLRADVEVVEKT